MTIRRGCPIWYRILWISGHSGQIDCPALSHYGIPVSVVSKVFDLDVMDERLECFEAGSDSDILPNAISRA